MKWFFFLCVCCIGINTYAQKSKVVLVIDPGHGGKDHGHLAHFKNNKPEKTLNLEIAQKLGKYITENLSNVEVHFTRQTDTYSSLDARVEFMNNMKADYVISIHCNGSANPKVYGTETHIHDFKSKKSYHLAREIEQQFKQRAARHSRGIKDGKDRGHSIQLLKYTEMPTVLVECGFLSNQAEANYLNSVYGQEIIASAIFRAFRTFVKKQHPAIDFEAAKPKLGEKVYRVQIMSSIELIKKDPSFTKLGVPVEAVEVNSQSMYKYKYYAGSFSTKKEASEMAEKARKNGFPDAFVVLLE